MVLGADAARILFRGRALFTFVAAVSCFLPTPRAMRVNPMVALLTEWWCAACSRVSMRRVRTVHKAVATSSNLH